MLRDLDGPRLLKLKQGSEASLHFVPGNHSVRWILYSGGFVCGFLEGAEKVFLKMQGIL